MKTLTKLVGCLKPSELQFLENYYKLKSASSQSKRLKLLALLTTGSELSDIEACQKIYRRKPNSGFSQLKKRLTEDIHNLMLINSSDQIKKSTFLEADIECRRQILLGKILMYRGIKEETCPLFTKALKLAEKFELADLKMIINDLLRTHHGVQQNVRKFDEYTKALNKSTAIHGKLIQAKELNLRQTTPNWISKYSGNQPTVSASEIKNLSKLYSDTRSPNIGFWYYKSMTQYHHHHNNKTKSYLYGLRTVRLIEAEPAVHSETNAAEAYLDVTLLLVSMRQFQKATPYVERVLHIYDKCSVQYLKALEVKFLIYFRTFGYEKAEKVVLHALNLSCTKQNSFEHSKWVFFQANLALTTGNLELTSKLMHQCTDLLKDKFGWQLEYRIVELLMMIEKREYDWLYYKIDSLRKLIKYHNLNHDIRIAGSYKLLNALVQSSGNFSSVVDKESELLRTVKSLEVIYSKNSGFEIISLHDWITNNHMSKKQTTLVN